jgi:cobalt-zinc-cadmium resistance protein CzcA
MAGLGIYNYQKLPIDAVPDITNVQVQINTQAPAIRRWKPSSASPSPSRR